MLFLFLGYNLRAQDDQINDEKKNIIISFPESSFVEDTYTYDPETNRYYLSKTIGNYPINSPLVLTPDQYEKWVLSKI